MQVFVGGGNAIFFLLTILFTGFLALVALLAWRNNNQSALRAATGVGAVVLGVYAALLVTAALASQRRVLSQGEVKWFCGFYLDCHLGVSVERVESAKTLTTASGAVTAKGAFWIITLRFHNSARNPQLAMTLYRPRAELIGASGTAVARSLAAESVAARIPAYATPLKDQLSVGHSPMLATVVFDVAADFGDPVLSIDEGFIVDRAIELVLVDDDNSILHEPTLLALNSSGAQPVTALLKSIKTVFPRPRLASR